VKEQRVSLKTYPIELLESVFSALRKSPAEFVQQMKYAVLWKYIMTLLKEGGLSHAKTQSRKDF
jgi:hypothetical protein